MNSGMFRGKESSNRIELSRLVQELSNFGVFSFLQLLGVGGWVDGVGVVGGVPHTCAHTCSCTHTHARRCMRGKHGNFMQMAAPTGFGEILGIPYDVICTCVCVHACAHGWGAPCHHPPPPSTHPPPPRGGPPESFKIQ